MCNPAIIALVGAGMQAKEQKDAADYQAGVDKNNARLAGYQASDALNRGNMEANAAERAGRDAESSIVADAAGSGISSSSGSAANAITASRMNAAADAARIRAAAAREAWGFKNEQQDLKATGRFRKKAGYMGALGTGLSGVGSASQSYADQRRYDQKAQGG